MLRRALALALWGYFGWYLGSLVATFTGTPSIIGPLMGVIVAAIAVVDWRRLRAAQHTTGKDVLQPSR